jgi:hypothetical protein
MLGVGFSPLEAVSPYSRAAVLHAVNYYYQRGWIYQKQGVDAERTPQTSILQLSGLYEWFDLVGTAVGFHMQVVLVYYRFRLIGLKTGEECHSLPHAPVTSRLNLGMITCMCLEWTFIAWKSDTNTKYEVRNQGKVAFESVGLSRAGTNHFLNPLSNFSTPAYDNSQVVRC